MTVYVVAQIDIHDRKEYEKYVAGFREIFGNFQGEILAVDEAPNCLEGEWPFTRTAIIRFPDEHEALRWYESKEYQAAAQYRYKAATTNLVLLKGR